MSGQTKAVLGLGAYAAFGAFLTDWAKYGFLGFLGTLAILTVSAILLALAIGAIVALLDLGCPAKKIAGGWFGFDYDCQRYGGEWVRRDEVKS